MAVKNTQFFSSAHVVGAGSIVIAALSTGFIDAPK